MRATSLEAVVAAEHGGRTRAQRLADMKNVYSSMKNRQRALGVSLKDVFSATVTKNGRTYKQYDAYNAPMPPGTAALMNLAKQAIAEVDALGVTHPGMYYATPAAVANLPAGLVEVEGVGGVHKVFVDPQNRAIITAAGTKKPSAVASVALPDTAPLPGTRPSQQTAQAPQVTKPHNTGDMGMLEMLTQLSAAVPNEQWAKNFQARINPPAVEAIATEIAQNPYDVQRTAQAVVADPKLAEQVAAELGVNPYDVQKAAAALAQNPYDVQKAAVAVAPSVESTYQERKDAVTRAVQPGLIGDVMAPSAQATANSGVQSAVDRALLDAVGLGAPSAPAAPAVDQAPARAAPMSPAEDFNQEFSMDSAPARAAPMSPAEDFNQEFSMDSAPARAAPMSPAEDFNTEFSSVDSAPARSAPTSLMADMQSAVAAVNGVRPAGPVGSLPANLDKLAPGTSFAPSVKQPSFLPSAPVGQVKRAGLPPIEKELTADNFPGIGPTNVDYSGIPGVSPIGAIAAALGLDPRDNSAQAAVAAAFNDPSRAKDVASPSALSAPSEVSPTGARVGTGAFSTGTPDGWKTSSFADAVMDNTYAKSIDASTAGVDKALRDAMSELSATENAALAARTSKLAGAYQQAQYSNYLSPAKKAEWAATLPQNQKIATSFPDGYGTPTYAPVPEARPARTTAPAPASTVTPISSIEPGPSRSRAVTAPSPAKTTTAARPAIDEAPTNNAPTQAMKDRVDRTLARVADPAITPPGTQVIGPTETALNTREELEAIKDASWAPKVDPLAELAKQAVVEQPPASVVAQPVTQVAVPNAVTPQATADDALRTIATTPAATAADVYSGKALTGLDNTGRNTITRNPDGTTTVTNQYGAQTTTMPDGRQAGTSQSLSKMGGLSPAGALAGAKNKITGAFTKENAIKAGFTAGGYALGGPLGALLGGLLGKTIANNIAPGPNSFPSAPNRGGADNARSWNSMSPSDRARAENMSPGASAAIDRAGGGSVGLY